MIYINKIENRTTFKIKKGYYLEILMPETMKLLGSTKNNITKDENGKHVRHLEVTEVVHCNIVNNDYQQESKVLYTFAPNKLFGRLSDISSKKIIVLKTFDSEFSYIEVWFTDENSKLLETEDKVNITLVISQRVKNVKMNRYSVQPRDQIFVKVYGHLSFAKNMSKNIGKKFSKNLSGKYSQKLLDDAKKHAAYALKTSSKRAIQKQQKQLVI